MRANGRPRIEQELRKVQSREKRLEKIALEQSGTAWKQQLEEKIPLKVYTGLNSAFCKAFSVIFDRGSAVIEKTYCKEELEADHKVRDYAVRLKGGRKELRHMQKSAKKTDLVNLAATTLEGLALGLLGIGLPDIVLFLGTLLRGTYEMALSYGSDHDTPQERLLILKMMQTSLSRGEEWLSGDAEVERMLRAEAAAVTQEQIKQQIEQTASVFATDMLLLKFVQGLPVIGVLGGAANPIYYHKIMRYVELKYRKRYLLRLMDTKPCEH